MDEFDPRQLPFLTRKMLNFEQGTAIGMTLNIWALLGETVYVTGFTKDGPFSFKVVAPADGARDQYNWQLPDVPISISVFTDEANAERGRIYITLSLTMNSTVVAGLISGYLIRNIALFYPNGINESNKSGKGLISLAQSADPAAGANATYTTPTGPYFRIHTLLVKVVTDATVANRTMVLKMVNPTVTTMLIPAPAVQTASQTIQYIFGIGLPFYNDANSLIMMAPLPPELWLQPASVISTLVTGLVAGDNISVMDIKYEQLMSTLA